MVARSFGAKLAVALLLVSPALQPAFADVKAGVDAWSKGEYEKAVKEWRDPALKGDADAQFNLGQAYKLGRGVKADLNVAADWYRRAAEQGHLQAADSYGHLLHYQGKITEALPYLQASSERGEPRAQYLLGTELFNGVYVEKDWVRAYALMTRASSAGMAPASRSLAQMDQYIPLEQRQQGTVLAGQMEQSAGRARAAQVAGFPINTQPPKPTGRPVAVPPSQTPPQSDAPGFPSYIPSAPKTGPVRTTQPPVARPVPAPVQNRPAPMPAPVVRPAPVRTAAAVDGGWRIQLGAFSNERNAQNLWNSLENRISDLGSLQPYLKSAGSVTRLQAGPFASRSAAEAMCSKVKASGQACIAVSK
jgi:cell division septation protein DedD